MILHVVNLASANYTALKNCRQTLGPGHAVIFLPPATLIDDELAAGISECLVYGEKMHCLFFWLGQEVPRQLKGVSAADMVDFVRLTERYSLSQTWY